MTRSEYSPKARNALRVLGVVLLLAGVFLAVRGGMSIADAIPSDEEFFAGDNSSPSFGDFAQLVAGMFLVVGGIGALNAGFLGAQSRYVAGETSGAVREFGSAFRGEPTDRSDDGTGPFCSSCGVRGDREARFCDACGHELAPR